MFMIEIAGVKVPTSTLVVKMLVTNNNSPIKDYIYTDQENIPTFIIFLLDRFFTLVIFHAKKIVILWLLRFPVFHLMSLSL